MYVQTFVKKWGEKSLALDQQFRLEAKSAIVHGQCMCTRACVMYNWVFLPHSTTSNTLTYNSDVTIASETWGVNRITNYKQ